MKKGAFLVLFVLAAGCSSKVMETKSPDGNYTIVVSERPAVDQPSQDIILQDNTKGLSVTLRSLKEDWDWVDSIKWKDDGKLAGVLVTRSFILIIDPEKKSIIRKIVLSEATNYPPEPYITDFKFTDTDTIVYTIKSVPGNLQREAEIFIQ